MARSAAKEPRAEARPAAADVAPQPRTELVNGRTRIRYDVQSGDTLWGICQKFKCSVDNLRVWNNLPRRGRRLTVGTQLSIWQDREGSSTAPARAPVVAANASATTKAATVHSVGRGETLWSIARRYGVTVDELKRWNGISDHRAVRVGQKLRIASR